MGQMGEGKTGRAKSRLVSAGLVLLLACTMLAGCGKKKTFEGGNLAFSYDPDKWTLECCSSEEYPVFELDSEAANITFMALKSDASMVEAFRESMLGLLAMLDDGVETKEVDTWSQGSAKYYTDAVYGGDEEDDITVISYGKTEGEWLILVMVEFLTAESDSANEAARQEAMEVIDSMAISKKAEVTGVEEDENLIVFYDIVSDLQKYGLATAPSGDGEMADQAGEGNATGTGELISDEEAAALQYVEKFMVEDYYGDKAEYPVYAPSGSEYSSGFLNYYEHGISFSASVFDGGTTAFMYQYFDITVDGQVEYWQESEDHTDIQVGEVKTNGDDRYLIATAKRQDYQGTPYAVKDIFYLDAQGEGVCVLWDAEISEMHIDGDTSLIMDELAKSYGISLDEMRTDGEWHTQNQKKEELKQDEYEPEEGSPMLTSVEGYQYLGVTTLTPYDGGTQCQAMAPMGRRTSVSENQISSHMHGVSTSTLIDKLILQDYMSSVKLAVDGGYDYLQGNDRVRNVWRSEMITMPEYEQASYVVFTYEEQDLMDEEKYIPQVKVKCFIRIDEDYVLKNDITLNYGEYDDSTNTLLKELETAYMIDLSRYYYEK